MRKILPLLLCVLLLIGCGASKEEVPPSERPWSTGDMVEFDAETTPSGVTLECEWTEYDVTAKSITFLLNNNTDTIIETGVDFTLEVRDGNHWKEIPMVENAGWPAVGIIIEPGTACAFSGALSVYDYEFEPGFYRVVKDGYSAGFTMAEGADISTERPYGFAPLEEFSAQDPKNCLVIENGAVSENEDLAELFLQKVSLDMDCQLRRVEKRSEGAVTVIDIIHENGRFLYRSLDSGRVGQTFFSYLITDGADIYLSNAADWETAMTRGLDMAVNMSGFSLLPPGCADTELVSLVQDMTAARLNANITRYKIWSPDGAMFASLTESPTTLSMGGQGYGTTADLQDYDGLETVILDITWDGDSVLLTCETLDGETSFLRAALESKPQRIVITTA